MDFSKLKLNEGVATGNNAFEGERKAKEGSNNSEGIQTDPVRQKMQLKQKARRTGTPEAGTTILNNHFVGLRTRKELQKLRESSLCDWRKELMEAAGAEDDPEHPYVEVMPHWKYKEKEAKKNMAKSVANDRKQGKPPMQTPVSESDEKYTK